MEEDSCIVVVQGVYPKGKHGPYAVASSDDIGLITFSLKPDVWSESHHPEPGTFVVLSQIFKKRAGWRALNGRFFKPSDEKRRKK